MDQLVITGGSPLSGTVEIGGAKNAALPNLCASLLTDSALTLTGLPALADIVSMKVLLEELGVTVEDNSDSGSLTLTAANPRAIAPYDLVRKMRASILVLGPLLARCGEAQVSLPGGCAIGNRPIDLHLMGLKAMGAAILLKDGYVVATAPEGLKGATITFPLVSVGATENLIMAATLADGVTVLENAAREPEVVDLADLLTAMGAKIEGAGMSTITIEGRAALGGATHRVIRDRIEAGSYAVAAAMTRGEANLIDAPVEYMGPMLKTLEAAGVKCAAADGALSIGPNGPLNGFEITTEPFPGFPTDMQAQFMALATGCDGISVIRETIFENRFMHVPELRRMGADISVSGNTATVRGATPLAGAQVMATDLRASMSLVIAALAADGETVVNRIYHLDRGYERLEQKLHGLGANVLRRQVPKAAG